MQSIIRVATSLWSRGASPAQLTAQMLICGRIIPQVDLPERPAVLCYRSNKYPVVAKRALYLYMWIPIFVRMARHAFHKWMVSPLRCLNVYTIMVASKVMPYRLPVVNVLHPSERAVHDLSTVIAQNTKQTKQRIVRQQAGQARVFRFVPTALRGVCARWSVGWSPTSVIADILQSPLSWPHLEEDG